LSNQPNKKITLAGISRISSQIKKQPEKSTGDAAKKTAATVKEDALTTQVDALKKLRTGTPAPVKAPQAAQEPAAAQLKALTLENRNLSVTIESTKKELERYRQLSLQAETRVQDAIKEREAADKARLAAEKTIQNLQAQNEKLKSQLSASQEAGQAKGETSFLTADKVARMVSSLSNELAGSMSGLTVKNVEVKLKVAFAGTDDEEAFILPTVLSGPEIKDNLHEVVLRFDRTGTFQV
jgi:chromosome segregation ATPase